MSSLPAIPPDLAPQPGHPFVGVRDVFTIGIGPSSSHTIGQIRAANHFLTFVGSDLARVTGVRIELYGSLALTGRGHRTDVAVLLGLAGHQAEAVDPDAVDPFVDQVRHDRSLKLNGTHAIPFNEADDLLFRAEFLPAHPNAMRFSALEGNSLIRDQTYYSIGGGAIRAERGTPAGRPGTNIRAPYPFSSAAELLDICRRHDLAIADVMLANEAASHERSESLRFVDEMGGLWANVPRPAEIGTFLAIASLGLPGLGNFVGGFLILIGTIAASTRSVLSELSV